MNGARIRPGVGTAAVHLAPDAPDLRFVQARRRRGSEVEFEREPAREPAKFASGTGVSAQNSNVPAVTYTVERERTAAYDVASTPYLGGRTARFAASFCATSPW